MTATPVPARPAPWPYWLRSWFTAVAVTLALVALGAVFGVGQLVEQLRAVGPAARELPAGGEPPLATSTAWPIDPALLLIAALSALLLVLVLGYRYWCTRPALLPSMFLVTLIAVGVSATTFADDLAGVGRDVGHLIGVWTAPEVVSRS